MITGTCALIASIAATAHINEYYTNSIHPGVGVNCDGAKIGAYYNSIDNVSIYAGYEFEINDNISVEVGGVTGYEYTVVPMLKLNYNNFFAMPTKNGAVIGIQFNIGE